MAHKAEYLEHITELRSWARARRLYMQARGIPDYKDTCTRLERIADILEQDSRATSSVLEEMAVTLETPPNDVPRTVAGLKAKYKTVRGVLAEIATRFGVDDQKTGWTKRTRDAVMQAATVARVPDPAAKSIEDIYNALSMFRVEMSEANLHGLQCAMIRRPATPSRYENLLRQIQGHIDIIRANWSDRALVAAIANSDADGLHGMLCS